MKKLLMILLSTLLLCGCGKNEKIPETDPAETTIPTEYVQEVTGPEAIMDPEDITEPPVTKTVTRLVRTSVLNDRGVEILYREYSYDEYGRQTEYWEYGSEGELTSFASTVYTSDTAYETTFDYGESGYIVRYVCDEQGNLIHQETEQDGLMISSTDCTYDEAGNLLTMVMTSGDAGETSLSYEYALDENGNPLTVHEYQDGKLMGWTEYEYDGEGRQTGSRYYHNSGEMTRSTVTIWEENTQTQTSYDAEGTAYLTQITITDDRGNVLSKETWQEDEMVSRTEYIYEDFEIIAQ